MSIIASYVYSLLCPLGSMKRLRWMNRRRAAATFPNTGNVTISGSSAAFRKRSRASSFGSSNGNAVHTGVCEPATTSGKQSPRLSRKPSSGRAGISTMPASFSEARRLAEVTPAGCERHRPMGTPLYSLRTTPNAGMGRRNSTPLCFTPVDEPDRPPGVLSVARFTAVISVLCFVHLNFWHLLPSQLEERAGSRD
jgi:hypothetical protein